MRWELAPDFQPLLEEVLTGSGQVVKETPAKLVSLIELRGQGFYVKRYRYSAIPLRPYKYWFKTSQARQEWELARDLEQKGIPIVRHVALGERWHRGGLQDGILITEAFHGIPVREAGQVFADKVLSLVLRMHEAGAIQHDLHGANVLVNPDSGEVRLVDLHGIEMKLHLSDRDKAENLARLRKFQAVEVSPDIEVMSREMRRRMYHQRSFRAWKRNRDFEPQEHGRHRWQVRSGLMNDEIRHVLQAPDSFLDRATLRFKNGRSSMVAAGDSVVLKRYNFKKPFNLIKDLFRPSRALASFRKAYHLELSGIPTARPLAAADRRVGGLVTGGYFLMERIPLAVSLRDYRSDANSVVRKVALLIAQLHEEGFSHRDLKTSNIMFDQNDRPVLIDLDGLSYESGVSHQRAQTDLRRLWAAAQQHPQWKPTFALRFMRHYCRERNLRPKLFLGKP